MSSERRRAPRVRILGKMHGQLVALDVPMTVIEISLGGLSFETSLEFPLGAEHEFRLTLGDESTVSLKGRIVYCVREASTDKTTPRFVVGVQFVEEDAEGSVGELIDRIE